MDGAGSIQDAVSPEIMLWTLQGKAVLRLSLLDIVLLVSVAHREEAVG